MRDPRTGLFCSWARELDWAWTLRRLRLDPVVVAVVAVTPGGISPLYPLKRWGSFRGRSPLMNIQGGMGGSSPHGVPGTPKTKVQNPKSQNPENQKPQNPKIQKLAGFGSGSTKVGFDRLCQGPENISYHLGPLKTSQTQREPGKY